MPKLAALAITIVATVAVCLGFASLAAWGFGRVGRSLVGDLPRYQALYSAMVTWLDGHGISVAGLWAEHFNVGWLLRATQQVTTRVNTTLSFWVIVLVYVMLGLLEVENIRRKIERLDNPVAARVLLDGSAATAAKFRRYLVVRTQMSAVTGLLVGAFAWVAGLPFALEWGVIAFVLDYIPFIGPFVATLFPTLLAMTQFESWPAVVGVFVCLNIIQFVVGGSRAAGGRLHVVDFTRRRAVFDLLLDVPVGPVRHLHRRAGHAGHSDVLRRASIKPLGRRSVRRTGSDEAGQGPGHFTIRSKTLATHPLAGSGAKSAVRWRAHGVQSLELPAPGAGRLAASTGSGSLSTLPSAGTAETEHSGS